jgi:hypothetical protein
MGRDACLPSSSLPECSHGFTPKNEPGSVTDVITTSASQQTRVDFSVSNGQLITSDRCLTDPDPRESVA